MKKLFAVLLAVVMMMTILPMTAMAEEEDVSKERGLLDHTHTFIDYKTTVSPSCEVSGLKTAKCEYPLCPVLDTQTIPATGHDWKLNYGDVHHWQECSKCHWHKEFTGHVYNDATCTEPKTCYGCPKTQGEPLGHDYAADFTIDTPATCTTAGSKSRHCTRCSATTEVTEIPALNHDYATDFTVDKEATCTEPGSKSKHCSRCEATTDVSEIPALNHNFAIEFTIDKEATCTEPGSKSKHCSRCEATTNITPIDALGHEEINIKEAKDPTCTEDGWTKGWKCSRCDAGETSLIIPAGHVWEETLTNNDTHHWYACKNCTEKKDETVHTEATTEIVITPATCEQAGSKKVETRCNVCDKLIKEENVELTKLGHDYDATTWAFGDSMHWHPCKREGCTSRGDEAHHDMTWTVWQEPTCEIRGHKSGTCSVCTYAPKDVEIEPLGHDMQVTKEGYPATCYREGLTDEKTCAHGCGKVEPATVIEKLPHKIQKFSDTPATCTTPGHKAYEKCENPGCDYTTADKDTEIPAIGHKFGSWFDAKDGKHHEHVCNICKYSETEPHKWDNGVVTRKPTYYRKGIKTYSCTVAGCEAQRDEYIARLYYNWGDNPKTGDNIMTVVAIMLIAGAGLAGVAIYSASKKKRK